MEVNQLYKNNKQNIIKYLTIALLTIVIIMSIKRCSEYKNDYNILKKNNSQLVSNQKVFKSYIDSQGNMINEQKATILLQSDEIVKKIEKEQNLKKLIFSLNIKNKTTFVPDKIKLSEIVYLKDSTKCLPLPIHYVRKSQWWSEISNIDKDGYLTSDSIEFYSEPNITVGYKKRKLKDILLFKKEELMVTYKDNNPYSKTITMDNVYIKSKSNNFSFGISTGYCVTNTGFSPYIGIGVNYSIIKF